MKEVVALAVVLDLVPLDVTTVTTDTEVVLVHQETKSKPSHSHTHKYNIYYTPPLFIFSTKKSTYNSRGELIPEEDANPGDNLFITGLSVRTTGADLEDLFGKYGKVKQKQIDTMNFFYIYLNFIS